MNRKIFIGISLVISLLFSTHTVASQKYVENNVPEQIKTRQLDKRAAILADYLATHNSPLQYHAQDFVDAARVYDLDWRLVAAISGVESTFGKFIPGGYNGWGWGVYGNQAIYFTSWRDGIFTVSLGLRENYLNKGLTEPYAMNRVYATSPYWGYKVTYFMNDLEKYAQKYDKDKLVANIDIHPIKIAAISGQLAMR